MRPFNDQPVAGDPLIDEVRSIRKAISDQFDNDVDRLCDYLQQRERDRPRSVPPSTTEREPKPGTR
jgi:hypothetical protein